MIAQRAWKPALAIIIAALLQWALILWDVNPTWDAAFNYAYARSIVFDNDLQIDNDLQLSYPSASDDFVLKRFDEVRTENGRVHTPFALGSALVWTPWLAILKLSARAGQALDLLPSHLTGYEWYFTIGVATLSGLMGWLAFWPGYLVARSESGRFSALAATLTLLFTTPLLYYQTKEPLFAHATSALVVGLVLYVWWKSYLFTPSYRQALLLGGLIGLGALVRSQHIVFLSLPVISTLWWWFSLPAEERGEKWLRALIYLGSVGGATIVVFSIQMAHWYSLFNEWITIPYGSLFMDWRAPQLVPLLFSTFRGVLPWMPIALLSIIGLFILGRSKPRLVVPILIVLLLITYINSSTRDWFGGGGYGPRRFSDIVVIFILGYAALLQSLPARLRKQIAIGAGAVLLFHQWILLRYALEEDIGGRVVAMYPTFEWIDQRYIDFGQQILRHANSIFRSPEDFFVLQWSPLARFLDRTWPIPQLTTLIATSLFLLACYLIGRWFQGRLARSAIWFGAMAFVAITVIIATDLWILFWA